MTGIDQVVCSATVIGPRHVITAAACVIDPGTGEVIADRQVMPRLDLKEGNIPVSRRFIMRVYLPVEEAPLARAVRWMARSRLSRLASLPVARHSLRRQMRRSFAGTVLLCRMMYWLSGFTMRPQARRC
nr:hypothetical protein [Marinicella sp. W31]MDC2879818.1 hypothetical protein [Marinicella sp. W31]